MKNHAYYKNTPAQVVTDSRRASSAKAVAARRAKSKNAAGRPRSVQIRAADYARLADFAAGDSLTMIDEVTRVLDCYADIAAGGGREP